jgi:hypothetical protein
MEQETTKTTWAPFGEARVDSVGVNVMVKAYDTHAGSINRGADDDGKEPSPEQLLAAAVLKEALDNSRGLASTGKAPCRDCYVAPERERPLYKQWNSRVQPSVTELASLHTVQECALNWFQDNTRRDEYSFLWVCEVLGLEAGYVRRLI